MHYICFFYNYDLFIEAIPEYSFFERFFIKKYYIKEVFYMRLLTKYK